jgi:hypothetical protein
MKPTDPEFLQIIADHLIVDAELVCSIEYPGCVVVPAADGRGAYWFGTANGTWQGDRMDDTGQYLGETLNTNVPASEANPSTVAVAIYEVLQGDCDPNRCPVCGGLLGDNGCVTIGCPKW